MDDSRNDLCTFNNIWSPDLNLPDAIDRSDNSSSIPHAEPHQSQQTYTPRSATPNIDDGSGNCWTGSFVDVVLVPTICALGVLGNILTLVVLSRRRLAVICDSSERNVHVGLRALAVSDLLVCLCQLPQGFIYRGCFVYFERTFQLVYWTYSGALINTFLMSSAWLIVTMAIGRYLTTAYPFRFRAIFGMTGAKVSAAAVFVASFLLNLPRLFEYRIETIACRTMGGADDFMSEITAAATTIFPMTSYMNDTASDVILDGVTDSRIEDGVFEIYMQVPGWLRTVDRCAEIAYLWIYFGFGVCIPLTLLAVGNCGLVIVVRRSSRLRCRYRVSRSHVDCNDRVTSVLISVVIAYLLLVTPAEILMFVERQLLEDRQMETINSLVTALNVANLLQTVGHAPIRSITC